MSDRLDEVRRNFPAVFLTLMSIVVALVLENLIDHVRGIDGITSLNPGAALVWLEAVVMLLLALGTWLISAHLVLALRWDIGVLDAAGPFFFLILMNMMIALIGTDPSLGFLYLLVVGQLAALANFRWNLQRASRRADNEGVLAGSNYRTIIAALIPFVLGSFAAAWRRSLEPSDGREDVGG